MLDSPMTPSAVAAIRTRDGAVTAADVRDAQLSPGARCLLVDLTDLRDAALESSVLAVDGASLPVVAALGHAATPAAVAVALVADLRVLCDSATVRVPVLCGGTSVSLPAAVGDAAARRLLLVPTPLSAAAALAAGLVHEMRPQHEVVTAAQRLAESVAAAPAGHGAAVRRALGRPDVKAAMEHEATLRAVARRHSP